MKPRLGADFRLIIRRILFRHNDFSSCASTCAVVVILKYRFSPPAVCKSLESATLTRPNGLASHIQALPLDLVHQAFNIHTALELESHSIIMGSVPVVTS